MKIVSIVEGHGDQSAVPLLIRRIVNAIEPGTWVDAPTSIRKSRSKLLKEGELERAVTFAALQLDGPGGILIVLDADEDCPATLGMQIRERARAARPDKRIEVVLAKQEFEAWVIASATSLAGRRNLLPNLQAPQNPEELRDAKGWLTRNSQPGRPYKETIDQPAFAELLDLEAAKCTPSFRKLWRDLESLISGQ